MDGWVNTIVVFGDSVLTNIVVIVGNSVLVLTPGVVKVTTGVGAAVVGATSDVVKTNVVVGTPVVVITQGYRFLSTSPSFPHLAVMQFPRPSVVL